MASSVTLKGYAEFERAALVLGRVDILRDTVKEGADVVADQVRANAPGSIKDQIVSKLSKNPKLAIAFAAVDTKLSKKRNKFGKPSRYAYIVEYGAKPHAIKAFNKAALKLGSSFAEEVKHPGFSGLKYFARGVRQSRSRAKSAMESKMQGAYQKLNGLVA